MKIKEIAARTLQDSLGYLHKIDSQVYAMPLDLLFGASIGQHTRHFVEFYQCLMDQTEHQEAVVNYALRARELRVEEDPLFAAARVEELCKRLLEISENIACRLVCDEHLETPTGITVDTNVERELIYNIEHTIHHLAIIKIGVRAVAPQIELPAHFGIAPSTIRHRQNLCAQ